MNLPRDELLRISIFALVLAVMAIWEHRSSRPVARGGKYARWLRHLTLGGVNALTVRLMIPLGAVELARQMTDRESGLITQFSPGGWPAFIAGFVVLDLAIYLQHRVFHAVPVLWRLHRMHHADRIVDASTAFRFHPVEILLSAGIKLGVVVCFGPPPLAVMAFEIVLSAVSLFNHGLVEISRRWEPLLRWLVVTPGMHRIHHSVRGEEMNRNFGFNLPWWDRLLGTYLDRAIDGAAPGELGVAELRDQPVDHLRWMLTDPVRNYHAKRTPLEGDSP
jgi:sterol desaturase/sphingolipid hydroxylase (fatty acid hydroxylase superfamily)